MFTGIVDHVGIVSEIREIAGGCTLAIQSRFSDFGLGESIAVDGTCLTVTRSIKDVFEVELSPETLKLTRAIRYEKGTGVNLERPVALKDRMGGHVVTGHIDQVCHVVLRKQHGEFLELGFGGITGNAESFLIKKGSISLNGTSLTVNEVEKGGFQIMLIPHTLERTNLVSLQYSDVVNVEFDWMMKVIVQEVRNVMNARGEMR